MIDKLKALFKKEIDLKFKNNSVVFLSATIEAKKIKLNLHQGFSNAPEYILKAIYGYLINNDKNMLNVLRNYIEGHLTYKKKAIINRGECYNLNEIFSFLNIKYFNSEISDVDITWFDIPKYKKSSSITFGNYDNRSKLIKINKLLDSKQIPLFFITFVIYHEMLHHIFPIRFNKRREIHYKEFKKAEKQYAFYDEAKNFEKNFLKGKFYGRT